MLVRMRSNWNFAQSHLSLYQIPLPFFVMNFSFYLFLLHLLKFITHT